jgi:hypothetical protein
MVALLQTTVVLVVAAVAVPGAYHHILKAAVQVMLVDILHQKEMLDQLVVDSMVAVVVVALAVLGDQQVVKLVDWAHSMK